MYFFVVLVVVFSDWPERIMWPAHHHVYAAGSMSIPTVLAMIKRAINHNFDLECHIVDTTFYEIHLLTALMHKWKVIEFMHFAKFYPLFGKYIFSRSVLIVCWIRGVSHKVSYFLTYKTFFLCRPLFIFYSLWKCPNKSFSSSSSSNVFYKPTLFLCVCCNVSKVKPFFKNNLSWSLDIFRQNCFKILLCCLLVKTCNKRGCQFIFKLTNLPEQRNYFTALWNGYRMLPSFVHNLTFLS